jgi:hypothetical protein
MAFDTTDPAYRDLLARVLQTDARVVPFVGAGIGVYGDPQQRLPLWRELLQRLIDEGRDLGLIPEAGDPAIDRALRNGHYIEATDRILGALGEPTFKRVVERELDETDKPTPPAVAELVAVGWSLIVTTNLDRLIARAYLERHKRPINRINNLDTHKLATALAGTLVSSETALAQIHGDIDVYPSWRLTRSHYEQLLQDPGYVEALRHLFMRHVFFVGFGLQDDDFDFVLGTIAQIYPAGPGQFFALIARARKRDPLIQELIRRCGLRPIFYDADPAPDPADPFCGHRAVYECLEHLAATWAKARTELDVTLKYFPELDPDMVGRDQEVERLAELLMAQGCVAQVLGLGGLGKTSLVQQFLADRRPEIAAAGYRSVFGCSFYRADIGQFIHDTALATVGPGALSLPQQVDRICEHVQRHRTLLMLDGVEAVLDAERQLRNPYVMQILESVVRGRGAVVVTSRVPVRGGTFEHAPRIEVTPLSSDQILDFLHRWGLDRLGDTANRRLIQITAGHPLALRILAGVLRDVPAREAISTIERSAVIDLSDEVDPLRENRLARILGSYFHHLDEAEIAFLDCSTAFGRPASYPLVEAALARDYPDTSVNEPLVNRDLRPIVADLLERRLLTASTGGELSSHPTVQEYFARHARQSGKSLVPIHRHLGAEYLQTAPPLPETFEEATPLLIAARHAAACEDWTLFDDLFRRRLMRGFRRYLCNNLGAWEEALALGRLGEHPSFPTTTSQPGYYPFTVARCLKHLGRSSESRAKYLESLRATAAARGADTAIYVNNLLTLLIWRGELDDADRLVELNVRALSWIAEPWRHRWQIEHGFSSIAYLRMLQGALDTASVLFDHAAHAWDGYPEERPWIYDYYPYYRSELVLLADPTAHDKALAGIESLLSVARTHGWPESICRGHIQAAVVQLDRSGRHGDPAELTRAAQRLDQAHAIAAGMNVADVAIAHHLARLKVELARRELQGTTGADTTELERLTERVEVLIEASGLALATPEVIAARGALAYLGGSVEAARALHERAVRECRRQGNALTPNSRRSLVNWLGERLGLPVTMGSTASEIDLIRLVGSQLSVDWMTARLDELS